VVKVIQRLVFGQQLLEVDQIVQQMIMQLLEVDMEIHLQTMLQQYQVVILMMQQEQELL